MIEYLKMRIALPILAISLLLARIIESQDCPPVGPVFSYPRTFILRYYGPPTPQSDEMRAAEILGNCRTTREHAAGMRQYFGTFGIDFSTMTNPYETFENERFSLSAFGVHPDGDYRVLLSSFYSFAEVSNAKVTFASWALNAKVQLSGEKSLAPGYVGVYGMYRLIFPRQEFCIEFRDQTPLAPFLDPNINSPVDFNLKSDHLGNGNAVGLAINNNGTIDVKTIFTFGVPEV